MSAMDESSEIIATLAPSPLRRLFGVSVLGLLALLILWSGATAPMAQLWRLSAVAIGLLAMAAAWHLWKATDRRIELRTGGIFDGGGRCLARMSDIASVDRGVFVAKPSNGFLVRLKTRHPVAWAPGLYWRYGRVLGIGGAPSGVSARAMADLLALRIAEASGPR